MFDILRYDFGRDAKQAQDRLYSCGAYNVVFNMGAGANWLAWVTCTALFDLNISETIKNNEVIASRNSLLIDVMHPWDIQTCTDQDWMIEKLLRNNLIIIDMTEDELRNVTSLAKLKYHLNEGHPPMKDVPTINPYELAEYKCLQDFKQYAIDNMDSRRLFILNYKSFFIEFDESEIDRYAKFFNIFNESRGGRVEAFTQMLRKYTLKNTELMEEYNMEHLWQWNS